MIYFRSSESPDAPLLDLDGEFELGARLGEGGGGSVFEATQVRLQRQVAVKRLHAWRTVGAERRFRDEATLMGRVAHPNIVPVLMHGHLEGAPALVMERVDGLDLRVLIEELKGAGVAPSVASLRAVLASDALPWAQATPWWKVATLLIAQIARALDHAHRSGVLHRDLKPSNILLSKTGAAQLTDFGIALPDVAIEDEGSRLDATSGNLGYCSPEELDGERSSVRSDVFSLGLVAREFVSLRDPYSDQEGGVAARMLHIAEGRIQRLDRRFPANLAAVLDTASAHDPADRYASADDFARDLENVCAGRAVSVEPESRMRRYRRWWGRHGRSAAALLALVALVIVVPVLIQGARLRGAKRVQAAANAAHAHLELAVDGIGELLVGVAQATLKEQPLAETQRATLLASGARLGKELARTLGTQSNEREESEIAARIYTLRARSLASLIDAERRTGQLESATEHIDELRSFKHSMPAGAVTNLETRLQLQDVIIALELGDLGGVERLAAAALSDLQELVPQDGELRKFKASLWNARVEAALARSDFQSACSYGAAATAAGREWLESAESKDTASGELSRVLGNYAAALIESGEIDDAEVYTREAIALLERLERSHETEASEAIHWNNIGAIEASRGRLDLAEEAERRALDIQSRHLAAYPRSIFHGLAVARTHFRLGLRLLGQEGRQAELEEHFVAACEGSQKLCDGANPTWLHYSLLAQTHCQLGIICYGEKDLEGAHERFGRSVTALASAKLQRPGDSSLRPVRLFAWQQHAGLTLQFQGETGVRELMRYRDEFPGEAQVLRNVASMLCHLGSKVQKSGGGQDPDAASRVAGYHEEALNCLQRAVDLGGLPLELLQSHAAWKPLHDLAGFDELVERLR